MQGFCFCDDHRVVTGAPPSRRRQGEAGALALELVEVLLDENRRCHAYDRRYLARLLEELLRAADAPARRKILRRLEAGIGSIGTPTVTSQARNDPAPPDAASGRGGRAVRAAPKLSGWRMILVLGAGLLLAAATLALADQGSAGGAPQARSDTAAAPLPVQAAGAASPPPPQFDVARISRDGVGVLAGRAKPQSSVALLADGEPLTTVEADPRGDWVLILEEPLKPGLTALALETRQGGARLRSPNTLVILRPGGEEDGASSKAGFGTGPNVLAVLTPQAGSQASRVLQRPAEPGAALSPVSTRVETVEFDAAGRSVVTGSAPANQRVTIRLNGTALAKVRADARGRWMFALDTPLTPGTHRLDVESIDEKGRSLARNAQAFEVGDLVAPPPGGRGLAVEIRQAFWAMVRAGAGMERRYTLVFRNRAASAIGMR